MVFLDATRILPKVTKFRPSVPLTESYERAYPTIVQLQMLSDLERAFAQGDEWTVIVPRDVTF